MTNTQLVGYIIGTIIKNIPAEGTDLVELFKGVDSLDSLEDSFLELLKFADRYELTHAFNDELKAFWKLLQDIDTVDNDKLMKGIASGSTDTAII
jgi:hypothetical protein